MDTSIARRNILARIRAAQGRELEPSASEREAAADYLARHPSGPRPDMPADLDRARFIEEAQKMATTVDTVESLSDVPIAAYRYLAEHALPLQAIAWQNAAGSALERRGPRSRISQAERRRRGRSHRLLLRDCRNRLTRAAVRAGHLCVSRRCCRNAHRHRAGFAHRGWT